jgi:hypothetical protein
VHGFKFRRCWLTITTALSLCLYARPLAAVLRPWCVDKAADGVGHGPWCARRSNTRYVRGLS